MSTIEKALGRLRRPGRNHAVDGNAPPEPVLPLDNKSKGVEPPPVFDTQAPMLEVDINRLRKLGVQPPLRLERQMRDEYRRIKRPLIANALGRGAPAIERGNLIMITSAVAGEGKTFTSINLALSIAHDPDLSVVLVDGDVSRAHASKLLGVQDRPGLVDLLADDRLGAGQVVMPTSIESLYVLPAGKQHADSEELLSSARMERIVAALADPSPRRIILFDSAPLLGTPEACALSSNVGQVVMVVKASSTLRHQVTSAIEQLDPNKAINLVLNQSFGGPGGDDYGGYYGGYYGTADRSS
ncbi:AAA family ATPase [Methylonatrum kenyense]|uniref:AAA family ATPase n=1 Tax=Methylonatrum kenyense TaxID=455253 RepID=UPI0020BFE123|nr:AAA family ATPase [Methylonatrum kenyense]MCK8516773.1 AAA family ATPase [Methylonatrum kenyense]